MQASRDAPGRSIFAGFLHPLSSETKVSFWFQPTQCSCRSSAFFHHTRSSNLAPLTGAFLSDRLESVSNPGNHCSSVSSPHNNQGLRRQSREDSDCGSGQFDDRGRGVGIHQSIGAGASGTRFVRNSSQGKQSTSLILIRSLPPYSRQTFACG
jgi:hypothetical protein